MDDQQLKQDTNEPIVRYEAVRANDGDRYDPFGRLPKKRKLIAGLLAFLFPGTGYFYLGLMQKGLLVMMMIILDIVAIVFFASGGGGTNIPLIVLCSLLLPVIYFYNIFDSIQCTDRVNADLIDMNGAGRKADRTPQHFTAKWLKGNNLGVLIVAAGVLILFFTNKPHWLIGMSDFAGTYLGAIVLIAAGIILFLKTNKN